MVKVAMAGGSGQLAREIIDKLIERGHEVLGIVRKDPATLPAVEGVTWVQTNYEDKAELVKILKGTHTLMCFFAAHLDPGSVCQKRLIDAAVEAGVKRYAPSEWSVGRGLEKGVAAMPWYAEKLTIRAYLAALNKDTKVLEYTLFQVGQFMDVFVFPVQTTKHVRTIQGTVNLTDNYAFAIDGRDEASTATTVEDIATVAAMAVGYEGEWPVVGGMRGGYISTRDLIKLGEKIKGVPFEVEYLNEADLRQGQVKAKKVPRIDHPSIPPEQVEAFTQMAVSGIMVSLLDDTWTTSDEWNRIFPDYEFTGIEEFVTKAWAKR